MRARARPPPRGLGLAERDLLRAFPEGEAAELWQLLRALDERCEVVRPQMPGLRRERAVAVRKEQLGLALPARVERELARVRVGGGVLGADPEVAVAPRDPVRLAAPAAVDDPVVERQRRLERRDGLRCELLLPPGDEAHSRCDDLEHGETLPALRRDAKAERDEHDASRTSSRERARRFI